MYLQPNKIEDIQHKANLWLQILLQFNVYVAVAWTVIYGFHLLYNISRLQDFHGIFVLAGYIVAISAEFWRLYAGYSGNLRAQTGDLSTFLVLTLLLQMPLLLFLLLSVKFESVIITVASGVSVSCMLLQFIVGIYAWRELSYQQTELYMLRRRIYLQQKAKANNSENIPPM